MRRSIVIAKQAGDKLRTWCEDRGLMFTKEERAEWPPLEDKEKSR